jgi:LEA14-like dessication related protein
MFTRSSAGWCRLVWAVALGGCTPLGLWVYDDPVVTVSQITLQFGEGRASESPVLVAIDLKNGNDYPISTRRVELSLRLDGIPIGDIRRDSAMELVRDMVATMALPVALTRKTSAYQLRSLGSGTHTFAVRGHATFRTPMGTRKVPFAQEGSMIFGVRPQVSSGN